MDESRRKPDKDLVTKGAKGILNFPTVLDRIPGWDSPGH
jgi:hypothetical protein